MAISVKKPSSQSLHSRKGALLLNKDELSNKNLTKFGAKTLTNLKKQSSIKGKSKQSMHETFMNDE